MTITEFVYPGCPYCAQMRGILKELRDEIPGMQSVDIREIDEVADAETAGRYDYYYTPSFFAENRKIYEAHPSRSRAEAKSMMKAALLNLL